MAIDFSLTPEQIDLQQTARDFAKNEIKPIVQNLDESNDPNIVPWELCKSMFHKGVQLEFTSLLLPQEYGGKGRKCIDFALVQEELGAADVSIACSYFNLTAAMPLLVVRAGTSEQRYRLLSYIRSGEPLLFSAAESEPNVATSDLFCPIPDSQIGMKTVAQRNGDTYVLNGNKSALVTNAGIADGYFIIARTALDLPMRDSMSIFYVKADTPGLMFGKKTEMIGWKASHHAAIHLDVAIKNAQKAVEILGGYGVTKEYQAGKFLADAWIGYSCDFTRDILRLGLVNFM